MEMGGSDSYAIACPIITGVLLLLRLPLMHMPKLVGGKQLNLGFCGVIAMLWLIAGPLTTFVGPFTDVGNGYLAAWGGTIAAVGLVLHEYTEMKMADIRDQQA